MSQGMEERLSVSSGWWWQLH